jgi:tRNA 2-thiouridine synthesizing protein A
MQGKADKSGERGRRGEEPLRIEARGLRCPLPVLRLRKAVLAAPPGRRLLLVADDPAAEDDVPAFAAEMGWRCRAVGAGEWEVIRPR